MRSAGPAAQLALALSAPPRLEPGLLMGALGWAAAPLALLARDSPAFARHLLAIDRERMHALALALDHGLDPGGAGLGARLAEAGTGAIVDLGAAVRPPGLRDALRRMPPRVLARGDYRRLAELFREPAAAAILRRSAFVDGERIAGLVALPPSLRRQPVVDVIGWRGARSLVAALEWFGGRDPRGAAPLVEALRAGADAHAILRAAACVLRSACLRCDRPPERVGAARRIDAADGLRALAARFRNCLERYIPRVEAGDYAIYLWEDEAAAACCGVARHDRLGWFLDAVRRAGNAAPPPATQAAVDAAFARVGVPGAAIVRTLDALAGTVDFGGIIDEVLGEF